jgi:predicted amidohydrolase YtcJ
MARFQSYADRLIDNGLEVFHSSDCPTRPPDPPREWGWYWWACQPGCLPSGESMGPFSSFNEAARDALEVLSDVPEK